MVKLVKFYVFLERKIKYKKQQQKQHEKRAYDQLATTSLRHHVPHNKQQHILKNDALG